MKTKEDNNGIGSVLESLREGKGWSLRAAAEQVGLSHNQIAMLETGENSPSLESIKKLASAYGMTVVELLRYAGYDDNGSMSEVTLGLLHRLEKLGPSDLEEVRQFIDFLDWKTSAHD